MNEGCESQISFLGSLVVARREGTEQNSTVKKKKKNEEASSLANGLG